MENTPPPGANRVKESDVISVLKNSVEYSCFCLENFYFVLRYFPLTNIVTYKHYSYIQKNLIHLKIQNNQSEHLKTVCHDPTLLKGNLRSKTKPSPNERTRRTRKNDPRDTPPQSQEPKQDRHRHPALPAPPHSNMAPQTQIPQDNETTKAQHPKRPMPDSPKIPQAATTRQKNPASPQIPPLRQPEPELLPTIEKQRVYRSSISDNLKQYSLIATASSIKFWRKIGDTLFPLWENNSLLFSNKANYSRLSRHNNETQSQAQPIRPPPTARKIPSKPNKKPTRHRTPIPPQHRARDATLKRKWGQKPKKRLHPHPPNLDSEMEHPENHPAHWGRRGPAPAPPIWA